MIILNWIICTIINWFMIATLIDSILMGLPIPKFTFMSYPETFMITKKNQIDIQNNYECSAYSTAYIMRHFGIQASGNDLYQIMPNKLRNGYVYPKGIIKLLNQQGLKASLHNGNIAELKKEISKNTPVIVFIKVYKNKSYLHYVPVIGYDEEYLYIAESLKDLINANNEIYNRRVSIREFKKLWNTGDLKMPLYKYIFITVRLKKER